MKAVCQRSVRGYALSCTSELASERLLSSTENVLTDQRNRLAADRAEMIVLAKHNLREINYNYSLRERH